MTYGLRVAAAASSAAAFVVGMQGFAIGGFSGVANPDSLRLLPWPVTPLHNCAWFLAGWALLGLARGTRS